MNKLFLLISMSFIFIVSSCEFGARPRKKISLAKRYKFLDTRREKNPHVFFLKKLHYPMRFEGVLNDTTPVLLQFSHQPKILDQIIYKDVGTPLYLDFSLDKFGNIEATDRFFDRGIGTWKGYITKNIEGDFEFKGIWKNHSVPNHYTRFQLNETKEEISDFINKDINNDLSGVYEHRGAYKNRNNGHFDYEVGRDIFQFIIREQDDRKYTWLYFYNISMAKRPYQHNYSYKFDDILLDSLVMKNHQLHFDRRFESKWKLDFFDKKIRFFDNFCQR